MANKKILRPKMEVKSKIEKEPKLYRSAKLDLILMHLSPLYKFSSSLNRMGQVEEAIHLCRIMRTYSGK